MRWTVLARAKLKLCNPSEAFLCHSDVGDIAARGTLIDVPSCGYICAPGSHFTSRGAALVAITPGKSGIG